MLISSVSMTSSRKEKSLLEFSSCSKMCRTRGRTCGFLEKQDQQLKTRDQVYIIVERGGAQDKGPGIYYSGEGRGWWLKTRDQVYIIFIVERGGVGGRSTGPTAQDGTGRGGEAGPIIRGGVGEMINR